VAHRHIDYIPEYVKKYATQEAIDQDAADDDAGEDMSSVGSYDSDDEEGEAAGNMDDI
jgi:ubiquitin-conjugating enzyme E2 H